MASVARLIVEFAAITAVLAIGGSLVGWVYAPMYRAEEHELLDTICFAHQMMLTDPASIMNTEQFN